MCCQETNFTNSQKERNSATSFPLNFSFSEEIVDEGDVTQHVKATGIRQGATSQYWGSSVDAYATCETQVSTARLNEGSF